MIDIDGSAGEGGGQVLRTSLALATLTGRSVRLHRIRAGRRTPGLAPQHLTAVRALTQISDAQVDGDRLGSTEVVFRPRTPPRPGAYTFDVADAAQGGSAGSVGLLLQALLLPLALAEGDSRLTLRGGTHVAWSPTFDYLEQVFLPSVAPMGLEADMRLDAFGFYPAGGGQMTVEVRGGGRSLRPLSLTGRGSLEGVRGLAVCANLPAHVPQRMADRVRRRLADAGLNADVQARRVRGAGPGAGLFLWAEYAHARGGFTALGRRGKASETVADEACDALLAHHANGAPVDIHLADQLLLPAALAGGLSAYHTPRATPHLLTNAAVIRHFLPARIEIDHGTVRVSGSGL